MIGNARKQRIGIFAFANAILLLSGIGAFGAQMQGISPLSDYQYKQDFAQYETIKKEPDVQKRGELLLGFIKQHPISRILLYAATDYMACVKPEIQNKNWAKAISMEEALMTALPTEESVKAANIPVGVDDFLKTQLTPTRRDLFQSLTGLYYQSNNLPKAAEMAEKTYTLFPDKSMLPILADIYLKLQNFDKYLVYGNKILDETPIEQSYSTALQMAQVYIQKQNIAAATDLFSKVMAVYGDKVPPGVQEPAWNATRAVAYGVIATGVYASKDYPKAQELYTKVAQFDPKRDDAYYFIGMCKWQAKDQDGAIDSFAKAVVLKKTYAAKAQQYLQELYKAQHPEAPDGFNAAIAKAKTELGIN